MTEKEGLSLKSLKILDILMSLLLTVSLGLTAWCLSSVVELGKIVSDHTAQINSHTLRIASIESGGSPTLRAHDAEDRTRDTQAQERMADHERAIATITTQYGTIQRDLGRLEAKVDAVNAKLNSKQ